MAEALVQAAQPEAAIRLLGYKNFRSREAPHSFSVRRARFDPWFAGQAEAAGALLINETVVTELIQRNGRVVGVRTGREDDLYADVRESISELRTRVSARGLAATGRGRRRRDAGGGRARSFARSRAGKRFRRPHRAGAVLCRPSYAAEKYSESGGAGSDPIGMDDAPNVPLSGVWRETSTRHESGFSPVGIIYAGVNSGAIAGCAVAVALWRRPGGDLLGGALAVGLPPDVATGGFTYGYSHNNEDANHAEAKALDACRSTKDAKNDVNLRSLCKVIQDYANQCVAVAMDPAAGTPGVGWAVANDLLTAERQALGKCMDTAGPVP